VADADGGVESLLAQSDALFAVKRFATAAERAADAARRDPNDPRAYRAWSRALRGDGQFAEAARMADEAIRLAPESAQGFCLRSIALTSLARSLPKGDRGQLGGEAVASAHQAVRLAPHDPNSHLALAGSLTLTGDIAGADREVRDVVRLAPNSAATWVTASVVAISAKNWDAAISASRRALEIDPENFAALNNLGVSLRASGHGREGTRVLAEAARINPDAILPRQNLSRAGLGIVRVAILILLLPLLWVTQFGVFGFLVLSVGSNLLISKNPGLALRLERVGAPVALFFAGKSGGRSATVAAARQETGPPDARPDQPWSAVEGHRPYTLGNRVLMFGAVAAWAVALVMAVGVFTSGSQWPPLAVAAMAFGALGAVPAWIVRRRRRQVREWARELDQR
jgi:tetratricopeptide (TPR) repeat protein